MFGSDLKMRLILALTFVVYGLLRALLSIQIANFLLALFVIFAIFYFIVKPVFKNYLYKRSYFFVSKNFLIDEHTIQNEYCTVKYFPNVKIIVLENNSNRLGDKRILSLVHSSSFNVNKGWNEICRIFDSFITVDTLARLYQPLTSVDIKTLKSSVPRNKKPKEDIQIDISKNGPKFVEMNNIQPDPYSKGTNKQRPYDANFVNIDNVSKVEKTEERKVDESELIEMKDALSAGPNKKIDINNASASDIAILPGINIILAKKIVEYRDKNGLFKSVDEFIKVASLKDHFIPSVKKMVQIKSLDNNISDIYNENDSRIVDL